MKHPIDVDSLAGLRFEDGLIPVIAQDHITGAVLMLAYADEEALRRSLDTGWMTYWSRSREAYWTKGETSGHKQRLISLAADCDQDALLAVVEQVGSACHEGTGTCWSHTEAVPVAGQLGSIDRLAADRMADPRGRYTDALLEDPELAAAKIVEEAKEVAAVLRGLDNADPLEHELADLLYHALVASRGAGVPLADVLGELARR